MPDKNDDTESYFRNNPLKFGFAAGCVLLSMQMVGFRNVGIVLPAITDTTYVTLIMGLVFTIMDRLKTPKQTQEERWHFRFVAAGIICGCVATGGVVGLAQHGLPEFLKKIRLGSDLENCKSELTIRVRPNSRISLAYDVPKLMNGLHL